MNVSRRDFLLAVPASGAALAMMMPVQAMVPARVLAPSLAIRHTPVVSFHLDQPYLDRTGLEQPYIPPAGMRSGAPLAALSDAVLSRYYGFI